jgi:hypothetical protein
LLINLRNGTFAEAATPYGIDSLLDGRGLAVSDFDGDGGLDFITSNYDARAQYFLNRVPNRGHWLRIRLRGRDSNRDGIGAIIRARAGALKMMRVVTAGDGYASQFSRVAHFGLGEAPKVDLLEVSWPSGAKQAFTDIAGDRFIAIDEHGSDARLVRPMARK